MLGYRGTDTQELLDFLKRIPANQLIEATVTLKSRLRKVSLHSRLKNCGRVDIQRYLTSVVSKYQKKIIIIIIIIKRRNLIIYFII